MADLLISTYTSSFAISLPETLSQLSIKENQNLNTEVSSAENSIRLHEKDFGLDGYVPKMDGDLKKNQSRIKSLQCQFKPKSMDMDVDGSLNVAKNLVIKSHEDDDDETQVDGGEELEESDADDSVDKMSTSQSLDETDEENSNWLAPSSSRPQMTLSLFGKLWMFLDRLRTAQTSDWMRSPGMEIEGLKLDSASLSRMNLFSKKIFAAYIFYFK